MHLIAPLKERFGLLHDELASCQNQIAELEEELQNAELRDWANETRTDASPDFISEVINPAKAEDWVRIDSTITTKPESDGTPALPATHRSPAPQSHFAGHVACRRGPECMRRWSASSVVRPRRAMRFRRAGPTGSHVYIILRAGLAGRWKTTGRRGGRRWPSRCYQWLIARVG